MKCGLQFILCLTLLAIAPAVCAGEVIDRIVAVVNRGVVLQSDLDIAVRYHALLEGRPLRAITQQDVKAALDRLIDQQLLFEEMGDANSFAVSDDDARAKVKDIRAQLPEASSDQKWRSLLLHYGLDEDILQERVKIQVEILRFVDLRLRPNVRTEDSDVASYYRDEFLPRLRQEGAKEVPFQEVAGQIRQLLTERRIDDLLSAWLHNLREQSHVQIDLQDPAPAHEPASTANETDYKPSHANQ